MGINKFLGTMVLVASIVMFFVVDVRAEGKIIVIGATPVPHAEILKQVRPLLAAKGIDLQIKVFTDYVTPNTELATKGLDANFFQHQPFLADYNKARGTRLVSARPVYYEPLGIYSRKIKSLRSLKAGDKIAIPNDVSSEGRALILLHDKGIIQLKDPTKLNANLRDVKVYKVKVDLVEIEAAQLARAMASVTAAVINGNYAIDAHLLPAVDAMASEVQGSLSAKTYANIVAVREGDQTRPEIKELIAALHSPEIKKFITTRYKGSVVPVE